MALPEMGEAVYMRCSQNDSAVHAPVSVRRVEAEDGQAQQSLAAVRVELQRALVGCLGALEAAEPEVAGGDAQADLRRAARVLPQGSAIPGACDPQSVLVNVVCSMAMWQCWNISSDCRRLPSVDE